MKNWFLFINLVLVLLFSGCTSHREVATSERSSEYTHLTDTFIKRDSVHVHDSVFIEQYMRGDTFHIVRNFYRTEYRDRLVLNPTHDTIIRHDTLRITAVTEKTAKVGFWTGSLPLLPAIALSVLGLSFLAYYYFHHKL